MKILIVEDHPGIRFALKYLLELEDHQVLTAENADEALPVLDAEPIELVLLDLSTGGMSPQAFVGELGRRLADRAPLLGIMSGNSRIQELSTQLGADFWISKPFEQLDLVEKISSSVAARALRVRTDTSDVFSG